MPIHDWTRVRANRFHDFHQSWTIAIRNDLNAGKLPPGYFAVVEQHTGGPVSNLMTSEVKQLVASRWICSRRARAEASIYARKANWIKVCHPKGVVVAVVEIVSPGCDPGLCSQSNCVARQRGQLANC